MQQMCFLICLYASICGCFSSLSHASPVSAETVHFCLPLDLEEMQARDSIYAARKQALNLNVGPPRTVRMIYFLPNDRPYRASVVDSMKRTIRRIQTFYGEQMQAHGYGYKTFAVESDASGEPIVHRVDGQHADSHYLNDTYRTVLDELETQFDMTENVYFISIDNSTQTIDNRGNKVEGVGIRIGKNGGYGLFPGEFRRKGTSWRVTVHEIGHAFGLNHDFRDDEFIMSYGVDADSLSECNAEFLAAHPYFNPNSDVSSASPPQVEMISPTHYSTGAKNVTVQLRLSDLEGLHQVILFVRTRGLTVRGLEVKSCRGLADQRNAVVEFNYDGIIPYNASTSDLSNPPAHPIFVDAVDTDGNVSRLSFWLWEISRQHIATLEGHTRYVSSVAFSPDGATLATGSQDSTIRLWDVATKRNIAMLRHSHLVRSVAFSPDGTTLAIGSNSRGVELWDVESLRNVGTLRGHRNVVRSVAFSSDGMTLASASYREVKLWNVATRQNIATLSHTHLVESVAFSHDGNTIATGSWGGTSSSDPGILTLWNVSTRQEIAKIPGHNGRVTSVAFSLDGKTLASGSDDETVKVWKVATQTNIATFEGHRSWVSSVAFSPDGTTITSASAYAPGSWDNSVKLWDVATGKNVATYRHIGKISSTYNSPWIVDQPFGHAQEVSSVAFSPDGTTLASAGGNSWGGIGTVVLWDASEWTRPRPQTLEKISGDNQQSSVGSALANPFVVEVRDQNGNPLPGVPVRIVVTEGNGKLSGKFNVQNTTTDATGRAQITLTLGLDPGKNAVEVSVEGSVARIEETFYAEGIGSPTTPNADRDYKTWHLPNGTIARLGKGSISGTVAFSPDGHTLAVSSGIGIWLYDVATQNELALFTGHKGWVNSVAFSPDGTMLVSGSSSSYSGTLKLWDVSTGSNIATLGDNRTWRQAIRSVAFSPDGITIAAGSYGAVELWDVASESKIATLEGHPRWVGSIAYSPDAKKVAAGLNDDKVELWDINSRTKTTLTHEGLVNSVAFSLDGTTLASAGAGIVKLWDVATQTVATTLRNTYGPVAFSPDGIMLFAGKKLWDVNTTTVHATFDVQAGSVTFSPNGRTLATTAHEEVRLWDIQTKNNVRIAHSSRVESVAFSPDGNTLAAGRRLWDVKTQSNFATLQGSWGDVTFLPGGTAVLMGNTLWDLATRTILATFPGWFHSAAVSPNGTIIASGGRGSAVELVDISTRQVIDTLEGHAGDFNSGAVQAVAFSPDGMTLASGSRDKTIKLWNVATRQNIGTLEGHSKTVESVAFSPDGETLVSGSRDGSVRLWNVSTRSNTATLRHGMAVMTVAFSPDGSTVASGVSGSTIKLWDVAAARSIATLEGHSGWVLSIAFSPDGDLLASGSSDGTILLWDTSSYGTGATSDATFSFSLDANIAVGNQRVPTLDVATGSVVPIQLFAYDIRGVNGVSARFEYDEAQVGYDGFDPGNLLPNAQVLAVPATNPTAIDISVVSFGGQAAVDSGMVGSIRFRTTDSFSGTTLRLVSAELGRGDQREKLALSDTGVTLRLAKLTPDFNGDGKVDFGDFVAFGMRFGASRGDTRYEAKYDLDEDGMIGFGDFLIFGQEFGT